MALVNPNIALSVKPLEFQMPNALAQAAQLMQLQKGQAELGEYESAAAERNRLRQLNPTAPDYEAQLFRVNPQMGIAYRKERTAAESNEATRQKALTEATAVRQGMLAQAKRDISQRPSDANIMSYLEDIELSPLFNDAEKAQTRKNSEMLLSMTFDQRKSYLESQGAKAGELKPNTLQVNRLGQTDVVQFPAFGGAPTTVGTYVDVPLPAAVEAQKSRIAKAGATNVNVSTEKKYGERFGGLIAESDAAKLAAAEKAPEAAATADRVMDLIGTGKVITGTGANARLQIAKALNLAGGTDSEKIRNTEVLVSSLAETTLGAIKSSNLGAGQGFTNADRDFLEKAKAGQLSYDAKSLAELARLSRLAAEKSAESWNKRVKQIPAAALEGTGISTEPVVVPKRGKKAEVATPAPAGVDPALWNVMTPQERALWQK